MSNLPSVGYDKVLLTLDGSAVARQAAPHACTIARRFDSTLVFYTVLDNPRFAAVTLPLLSSDVETLAAGIGRRLHAEAEEVDARLRKLAEELGVPEERQEIVIEAHNNPAEAITLYAAQNDIDLIAMCTHGRGGLDRRLRGSVAESVLRHAPCPVLLVRAGE